MYIFAADNTDRRFGSCSLQTAVGSHSCSMVVHSEVGTHRRSDKADIYRNMYRRPYAVLLVDG